MKVIKPINNMHSSITDSDVKLVCELDPIYAFSTGLKVYSVGDYTPKVKPGRWEKIAHGYRYKDTYDNMLAVVYFRNGSYVAESCAEGFSTGRTKLFPNEDSAKTYVEEQYQKYVLNLIEVEE